MTRRSWEVLGYCAFLVLLLVVMLEVRHEVVVDRAAAPAPPALPTSPAPQPEPVTLPVVQNAAATPVLPPPPVAPVYTGNTNTHRFHALSCRYASCKNCTARFSSRADAIAAGYRPGGCCHP